MKAIRVGRYGGPEVLEVVETPVPEPRLSLSNSAGPTGGGPVSDAARQAHDAGMQRHPRGKIVLTIT